MKTKPKFLIVSAAILCCVISLNSFGQTPCDAPSGLSSTGITMSAATLSWTPVSGAARYYVMYQEVGSPTSGTVSTATESVTINSLNASSNYQWQVQTDCGSSILSAFSSPESFFTAVSCDIPTGANATDITSTSATLGWDGTSGAVTYNIQYRVTGDPSWTSATASTKTLALSSLVPSTQYEFQVQSDCGNSSVSAFSVLAKFVTSPVPSCNNIPTGLNTTDLTDASVVLNWSGGANDAMVAGYEVQYRIVGDPSWTSVTSITSSATISSLSPGTNYEWQVRSDCGNSLLSSFSAPGSFTTMSHAPLNTNAANYPLAVPDPNNPATWITIIASTGDPQADALIVHDWLLAHGCIDK